ncbi:MAG: PucR family transcriptional regulator ligand-binding domain-containing protein, partial [Acidimicrobiales bacterium]
MAAPPFSVRDVLALPALKGARLVAGGAGGDRAVRGVTVMAAPETVHYVPAGHLLLATGYTMAQDPASLAGLVPRLADAELAGLAVKRAGGLEDIPGPMREAADRLAFPLIEVPREIPLNDIAAAVLGVVLDHQATRLQRTAEIHERFTDVVLSGGATRDVAVTLQGLVDRPVAVLDPVGAVVVAVPPDPVPAEDGGDDAEEGRIEHPVAVGDERLGALVVWAGPEGLDDEGLVAVQQAAVAIALRQVQARALAEAHETFVAVSLEELVSGQVTDRDTLAERAATLG